MKRGRVALVWLIAVIGVGAWRALPLPDTPPTWCISVWYPSSDSGGLASLRAHADQIAVVNAFWYTPRPDGTLLVAAGGEDAKLLAEWRAAGLTIIPTIAGSLWQMIATPEARAEHVAQIVALVERMDYAGIDIDYEGFPSAARDAFSAFIEDLSAALHARGRLLTVAVHAKTDDAGTWAGAAAQDWTRIAPAVDVFAIMTYDYTNRNEPPGPLSPPAWALDVLAYAATVNDLRKVRLGLPFYGYTWQRDTPPATTTSWEAVQRLITAYAADIQRDPADMEARVSIKARGLPRQTIVFADSVAIEYKVEQILSAFPDLGGVAIWGIGGEDPANWDVLRAARPANCTT